MFHPVGLSGELKKEEFCSFSQYPLCNLDFLQANVKKIQGKSSKLHKDGDPGKDCHGS